MALARQNVLPELSPRAMYIQLILTSALIAALAQTLALPAQSQQSNLIMNIRHYVTGLMLIAASAFCLSCKDGGETLVGMTEPSYTVRLYPEGQDVDKGITENGVQITLGPICNNHIDTLVT